MIISFNGSTAAALVAAVAMAGAAAPPAVAAPATLAVPQHEPASVLTATVDPSVIALPSRFWGDVAQHAADAGAAGAAGALVHRAFARKASSSGAVRRLNGRRDSQFDAEII